MKPLRILVVEDEMTIAFTVEDMLTDLGHEVVGVAMRLPHALQLAASTDINFAILDVNLDGHMSFPVADVLRERGVPYLFATGYGSPGIDPAYVNNNVIKKPYLRGDLQQAIVASLG